MPTYIATLDNGEKYRISAKRPPTEEEIQAFLAQGKTTVPEPTDSGQGRTSSFINSAGRGAASVVPGVIGGAGYLTGSEGLKTAASDIEERINTALPVNPKYQDEFLMKVGETLGQAGQMLATGGVAGAAGKALAGARGLSQAAAAAKGTQMAGNVMLGTGMAQGVRAGGQEAEKYGMTGIPAYLRGVLGGAIEGATEKLTFGMGTELAPIKKLLGDTLEKGAGGLAKAVGTEGAEEGLSQFGGNLATKAMAPQGVETPGLLADVPESMALGGIAGGALGGASMLLGGNETVEGGGLTEVTPPADGMVDVEIDPAVRERLNELDKSMQSVETARAKADVEQAPPLQQAVDQNAVQSVAANVDVLPATAAALAETRTKVPTFQENDLATAPAVEGNLLTRVPLQTPRGGELAPAQTAPESQEFEEEKVRQVEIPVAPETETVESEGVKKPETNLDNGVAKSLPKGAEKYASAPTKEGIQKHISKFYMGSEKNLVPVGEGIFAVENKDGKRLDVRVVETPKGFYFVAGAPTFPKSQETPVQTEVVESADMPQIAKQFDTLFDLPPAQKRNLSTMRDKIIAKLDELDSLAADEVTDRTDIQYRRLERLLKAVEAERFARSKGAPPTVAKPQPAAFSEGRMSVKEAEAYLTEQFGPESEQDTSGLDEEGWWQSVYENTRVGNPRGKALVDAAMDHKKIKAAEEAKAAKETPVPVGQTQDGGGLSTLQTPPEGSISDVTEPSVTEKAGKSSEEKTPEKAQKGKIKAKSAEKQASTDVITPQKPEIAIKRDLTKPEQMTPEEFFSLVGGEARESSDFFREKLTRAVVVDQVPVSSTAWDFFNQYQPFEYVKEGDLYIYKPEEYARIKKALENRDPIPVVAIESTKYIQLPEGYKLNEKGDLYVYQPSSTGRAQATPAPESQTPPSQKPVTEPEMAGQSPAKAVKVEEGDILAKLGSAWKLKGNVVSKAGFGNWTQQERDSVRDIFNQAGIRTNLSNPSGSDTRKSSFTIPSSDADTLQTAISKAEAQSREDSKRAKEEKEKAKQQEELEAVDPAAAEWMKSLFGREDFANPYNKVRLSDFVTGKSNTFTGMVNPRWLEGVQKAGALLGGGRVDFAALKKHFEVESRPNPRVSEPPTDTTKALEEAKVKATKAAELLKAKETDKAAKRKLPRYSVAYEDITVPGERIAVVTKAILKATGITKLPTRIEVIHTTEGNDRGQQWQAKVEGDKITLNAANLFSDEDALWNLEHELSHEAYLSDSPTLQKAWTRLLKTLENHPDIRQEVLSLGYSSDQITEEQAVRLAQKLDTQGPWSAAWQALKDAIRAFLRGEFGMLGTNFINKTSAALAARVIMQDARGRLRGDGTSGKGFSFAGPKAEVPQFMRDSLETAQSMAAAGKDSEEIRAVTGWFPGKYDGKMRWEIPDEGAVLRDAPEVAKLREEVKKASAQFEEVKAKKGGFTPEFNEAQLRVTNAQNKLNRVAREGDLATVGERLEHSPLFNAYPAAKNIRLVIEPMQLNYGGYFDPLSNKIAINSSHSKEAQISSLLHELQHWIQKQENFSEGGDLSQFSYSNDFTLSAEDQATVDGIDFQIADLRKEERELGEFFRSLPDSMKGVGKTEKESRRLDDISYQIRELNDKRYAITKPARNRAARDKYHRTAGEIESRDVQARQNFTPEQRKAIAPYSSENIAKEDAIVMFGEGDESASFSLTPEQDAEYLAAVKAERNKAFAAIREARRDAEDSISDDRAKVRASVEIYKEDGDEFWNAIYRGRYNGVDYDPTGGFIIYFDAQKKKWISKGDDGFDSYPTEDDSFEEASDWVKQQFVEHWENEQTDRTWGQWERGKDEAFKMLDSFTPPTGIISTQRYPWVGSGGLGPSGSFYGQFQKEGSDEAWKLRIADHENQSRMHRPADAVFIVGKTWMPESTERALREAWDWLSEKNTESPSIRYSLSRPEELTPIIDYGRLLIEEGYTDYEGFAKKLIDEIGKDKIERYLPIIYQEAGGTETVPEAPAPAAAKTQGVPENATRLANETTNQERAKRGLEPLETPDSDRYEGAQLEAQVREILRNDPRRGIALVAELSRSPRAVVSAVESEILLQEKEVRVVANDAATQAYIDAPEDQKEAAYQRKADASNALGEFETMSRKIGTLQGQTLAHRKRWIALDYSPSRMEMILKGSLGRNLTEAELREVQAKSKEITDLENEINADKDSGVAEESSKSVLTELLEEVAEALKAKARSLLKASTKAGKGGKSFKVFASERETEAELRFLQRNKRVGNLASASPSTTRFSVDPTEAKEDSTSEGLTQEDIFDLAQAGASYIEQGLSKDDFFKKLTSKFGDISPTELRTIYQEAQTVHRLMKEAHKAGASTTKTSTETVDEEDAAEDEPEQSAFEQLEESGGEDISGAWVYRAVKEYLIKNGVKVPMEKVFADITAEVQKTIPDITERAIRDLFSGYGKARFPSQEEVPKRLRLLRTLAQFASKLEDVYSPKGPQRSGMQRDEVDQAVRKAQRELNDLMKELGVQYAPIPGSPPIKTPLDVIKKRLTNEIEDLNKQLEAGKRTERARKGVDYDAEAKALLESRNRLKDALDKLDAPQPPTLQERVQDRLKALDKEIADLKRRRDTKDFKPEATEPVITQEIQTKIDERDALKDELEELQGVTHLTQEEVNDLAEQRYLRQIAELERQLRDNDFPQADGTPKPEDTPDLLRLKTRLKTLKKQRDDLTKVKNEKKGKTQTQLIDEAVKALESSIDVLNQQIISGDVGVKGRTSKTPEVAKVKNLRAERDSLREVVKIMRKAQTDAKRDPVLEKIKADSAYLDRQIKNYEKRIAEGNFKPRPKKVREYDKSLLEKQRILRNKKEEWAKRVFEAQLASRPTWEKLVDTGAQTLNTSRAILTSFDLSGVLRQGGFITMGNPFRAAKNILPMLEAFGSKKSADEAQIKLENRPNYDLYKRSGLFIAETDVTQLSHQEETFMSRWIEKIPKWAIVGGFVRGSQRSYVTFLNNMRADTFDALLNSLQKGDKPTKEEMESIANYINVATGRGNLGKGKLNQAAQSLNTVFFAPRLVLSRFQLLAGYPFFKASGRTKALVLQEYAKFLTGAAIVYTLGMMAQGDDDEEMEFDPRSSDFLKLRYGNTRVDPLAGLIQATVLVSRVATGEKKTAKGKVVPLRKEYRLPNLFRETPRTDKVPYGSDTTWDVMTTFARSKLSPAFGSGVDVLDLKNVVGQNQDPGDIALKMTVPMSFGEIQDAMTEHGVPKGAALSTIMLLGAGVQTYQK